MAVTGGDVCKLRASESEYRRLPSLLVWAALRAVSRLGSLRYFAGASFDKP